MNGKDVEERYSKLTLTFDVLVDTRWTLMAAVQRVRAHLSELDEDGIRLPTGSVPKWEGDRHGD